MLICFPTRKTRRRVKEFKQPGACVHAHLRDSGLREEGIKAGVQRPRFQLAAVMKGFEVVNRMP